MHFDLSIVSQSSEFLPEEKLKNVKDKMQLNKIQDAGGPFLVLVNFSGWIFKDKQDVVEFLTNSERIPNELQSRYSKSFQSEFFKHPRSRTS